jgi:surfactin synthase thioesterase subunit
MFLIYNFGSLLSYAGAAASTMATITKRLPDFIEVWCVQTPGKETREDEPQLASCVAIASAFVAALGPELERSKVPYALFGHSVGSWIMWEVRSTLLLPNPFSLHFALSLLCTPRHTSKV